MKKKYIENDLEKKFKDKHEYFSPSIVYVGVLIDTILRFTKFTCFFSCEVSEIRFNMQSKCLNSVKKFTNLLIKMASSVFF